jgi:hypothetical protein
LSDQAKARQPLWRRLVTIENHDYDQSKTTGKFGAFAMALSAISGGSGGEGRYTRAGVPDNYLVAIERLVQLCGSWAKSYGCSLPGAPTFSCAVGRIVFVSVCRQPAAGGRVCESTY